MRHTVWIGRLYSFPIGVHWSWFAVAFFVVTTLASTIDAPRATALGVAVASTLALFASVLLHEIGHAAVAKREGVATTGIVLFALGGIATLACEPPTPRAEWRIALAGPAMSALLAIVALLVLAVAERAGLGSAVRYVAAYAALSNGVLAAFNVLPAFPMDGGRAVHAAFWQLRRRRGTATRLASYAGAAFAAAFIAAGVVGCALAHAPRLLWLAAIGVFLAQQCRLQLAHARVAERLECLGVRDVMESARAGDARAADDAVLSGAANALDAVDVFRTSERVRIAVVDGDRLEGWLRRDSTLALLDAA